jgi:hypothetical protein
MHFPFTTVTHWLINYVLSYYLKNLHMFKQTAIKIITQHSMYVHCTMYMKVHKKGSNFFTTFVNILAQGKCFTNLK